MTDHALLQAPEVRALISYLDHEPAPMIVMNTDYQILAANTAYKRQFAVAGKPYLGHKCYAVSHHFAVPCDQAGEHCPLQSALATRAPTACCTSTTRRAGRSTSTWNCARSSMPGTG
jgi:PAS domain-containing protein